MAEMDLGKSKSGNTIAMRVAEHLKEHASEDVQKRLVEALTEETIKRRVDILKQATDALSKMEFDLRKIDKADHTIKDREGKVISEGFTTAKLEEIKKLTERIEKLTKAIGKGLNAKEEKDMDDVRQIVGNLKGDKGSGGGKPEGEPPA